VAGSPGGEPGDEAQPVRRRAVVEEGVDERDPERSAHLAHHVVERDALGDVPGGRPETASWVSGMVTRLRPIARRMIGQKKSLDWASGRAPTAEGEHRDDEEADDDHDLRREPLDESRPMRGRKMTATTPAPGRKSMPVFMAV
jgi:hypothetical protein